MTAYKNDQINLTSVRFKKKLSDKTLAETVMVLRATAVPAGTAESAY